jgi:tRNA threonylcarbamoyladenosine biosynthesis protein TsaE
LPADPTGAPRPASTPLPDDSGDATPSGALRCRSPEATRDLGRRLGQAARPGDVLLLEGGLGSGKTVLVQGLARGLSAAGEVTSPTFVLVHQHPGRLELTHADLYRLDLAAEAEALGLLDLSAQGVLAVEWPERWPALAALASARLRLSPGASEEERLVEVLAAAPHLAAALA